MAAKRPSSQPSPPAVDSHPLPAGLVAVTCRRCGQHLVDTLPTADVWCAGCRVWTLATVAVPARPRQRRLAL
jgi:hypothetical protein